MSSDKKEIDIIPPKSDILKKKKQSSGFEIFTEKGKKKKKLIVAVFCFFLLFFVCFFGSYFFIKKEIKTPLNHLDKEEKIIEFELGDGLKSIARKLKTRGIIKNELYFFLYVLKTNTASKLQAGKYLLSPSMSIPEIVQKMVKGEVVPDEIKVTIPEGFRLSQIEERINSEFRKFRKNTEIKISEFKISDFQEFYPLLADAPPEASLEGYLFPDTYLFPNKEDMAEKDIAESIVVKMLNNFQGKFNSQFKEEVERQKKTVFEIVIMASILEREVQTKEDRKIVSGIFWKRIQEEKPLESCASIAYILGKDKWRYSFEETRIESPYNTYLNKGLPKGPISNPGSEAIEAAIYPQYTEYNFFLTDPETGKTIFAKTFEEHNQNKVKYFK